MTLDSRISELAKAAKPTVAIIGLGGAGCNIVSWIAEKELVGGRIILQKAPNTGRIVWGAKVDESLAGHVRVTAVLTGVADPKKLT
jgi:cell division GTPase FtsZ